MSLKGLRRQVLKKNSDSEIISEYPGAAAEKEFRKMVFSPEALATAMTGGTLHYPRERSPHRTVPTIEELNDRKCSYKISLLQITSHCHPRDILMRRYFLSEKYRIEIHFLEYLNGFLSGVA